MTRTQSVLTVLAGATILAAPVGAAHAQWAVIDAGNIAQAVKTVQNTADTVRNTLTQIDRLKDQIKNQEQMLKSLDTKSFSDVRKLLDAGSLTLDMIQQDITSVGYTVNGVNSSFRQLFPKDQKQWKNVRYSDFDGYRDSWHTEINSATLAAARAQTSISSLDANNKQIIAILESSNSNSSGEVRQLQLVNQQLSLIYGAILSAVQNLSTTGRVLTDMAAASIGEKMATHEAAQRRLQNYTSRGQPAKRLQRLP